MCASAKRLKALNQLHTASMLMLDSLAAASLFRLHIDPDPPSRLKYHHQQPPAIALTLSFNMLLSLNIVLLLVFHKVYCGPIAVPEPELDGDHWNSTISPRLDALDIGTMTTIYGFEGCSSDDKTAVVQAFADAVDIAAAIAPSVDDIDKMQPYLYHNQVWWGKYTESDNADDWAKIKGSLVTRKDPLQLLF